MKKYKEIILGFILLNFMGKGPSLDLCYKLEPKTKKTTCRCQFKVYFSKNQWKMTIIKP